MSIRFAPIPAAVAVLMAAAPFTLCFGAPAAGAQAASPPPVAAAKAPKAAEAPQVRKIALKTGLAGGKMVYLDEKGKVNPVIRGKSATRSRSPSPAAKARSTTSCSRS